VHRAGRAGRIGSTAGGEVVSVVTREQLPALAAMVGGELGLHLDVVDLAAAQAQQAAQAQAGDEAQGAREERGAVGGGIGLLGREYDAARRRLLQDAATAAAGGDAEGGAGGQGAARGDDTGSSEQAAAGDAAAAGGDALEGPAGPAKEDELEAARKGLEDLFNLM
jgi:superfamily II DNA/RNA helicase